MNGLVDSHAFLWFVRNDPKLSSAARAFIADPNNSILLSAASLWEIAIKVGIGKLTLTEPYDAFMSQELHKNDTDILAIAIAHGAAVISLPFHHRDPFDRMIVAQAKVENMPIINCDVAFDAYGVPRIW
jgi:PIN domain nuclease of toxin-antitoxin system